MKTSQETILIFSCFVLTSWVFGDHNTKDVSMAEVQSCRGCTLNRLPDVKDFIYKDLPNYDKVVFKPIPGAPPELVLYDNNHQELERLSLSDKSREECNMLLKEWGFSAKSEEKEQKFPKEQEL